MNEREKQNSPLLDEEFLDDLCLEEVPKNTPTPQAEESEDLAGEDVLDMLDLKKPELAPALTTSAAKKTADDFDLDNLTLDEPLKTAVKEVDELGVDLDASFFLNAYHPWRISLYEKLPFICAADGGEKVFLIGYQNGQTARDKETHFYQHETDPIPYVISLDPDPHFISYSFFYGFFRQTLEKICRKHMTKDELRVIVKRKITDEFFKKYTFEFRNNPKLLQSMCEYVDTMTENIMETIEKGGEESDGCR